MIRDDIRGVVTATLSRIAPDGDVAHLDPDADFRDALELDSMDFLNVVVAWKQRLGVEVPEADYDRVRSVRAATDYLAARLSGVSAA
jgi:acyl carrier protein